MHDGAREHALRQRIQELERELATLGQKHSMLKIRFDEVTAILSPAADQDAQDRANELVAQHRLATALKQQLENENAALVSTIRWLGNVCRADLRARLHPHSNKVDSDARSTSL